MTKALKFAAALALSVMAVPAMAEPEMSELTIGLPVTTSTFLPLYLAQKNGFFKDEGVNVEIVAFKGGTDLVRGMIADAVDIGVTSLAGVTVGISAEQPLKAFYGGFNMGIFDWYAVKGVDSIKDAKGKRFGVTRIGSSTDFLTRYALIKSGLDPEKDVQIIQGGGSGARLAAMDAGQLDVNIFAPPESFIAADSGYTKIFSQTDLSEDYPFHVFFATEDFIAKNPETIKAVLRGFIRGVRLAKSDRAASIAILVEKIGTMEEKYAGQTYDAFIDEIFEDGRMPSKAGMGQFWDVGILSGEFTEPWDESKYLDRTYIDSYDQWKPE